jgi:hypothetical protein
VDARGEVNHGVRAIYGLAKRRAIEQVRHDRVDDTLPCI